MLARKRMEGKEGRKQGKDMNDLHQRRKCWDQQHCWWQGSGHCHANISLTWILSCFQGEARKQARLFDLRDKSFYLYPSRRPLFFWRHSKTRKQVVRVHFFSIITQRLPSPSFLGNYITPQSFWLRLHKAKPTTNDVWNLETKQERIKEILPPPPRTTQNEGKRSFLTLWNSHTADLFPKLVIGFACAFVIFS